QTQFPIRAGIQRALARIRTDLDAFSDTEAYALMVSGYRMVEREFARSLPGIQANVTHGSWSFLEVAPLVEQNSQRTGAELARMGTHLTVASSQFGKMWQMSPGYRAVTMVAALLALFEGAWWAAAAVGPFPLPMLLWAGRGLSWTAL